MGEASNGNGNGRMALWRSIIIACIPLVPSLGVVFIYQVRSNEQQQAEIRANYVAIETFKTAVFSMNTPLSTKVQKIEDGQEEIKRRLGALEGTLERLREDLALTPRRVPRQQQ